MIVIRFISHTGELYTVARLHPRSMLVLDANTVLTFIQHVDHKKHLDEKLFRGREAMENTRIVESYGVMSLPKLSRLDNTRLGEDITQRIHAFWKEMEKKHEGDTFHPF